MNPRSQRMLSTLGLMTSMSTLICCALPALLVGLGLGATLVGVLSVFPSLIWFSENKILLFSVSGALLALQAFVLWYNRNAPCPIDPQLREACTTARYASVRILIVSIFIYLSGFSFAFLLVP